MGFHRCNRSRIRLFLGGQYANDGLQVKWIAPIDQFLEFGAEIGNGDSFPGSARNKKASGPK